MPDETRHWALLVVGCLFMGYGIYHMIMHNHRKAFFGNGIGAALFLLSLVTWVVGR